MQINDASLYDTNVRLTLFSSIDEIKDERLIHNIIASTGLNIVIKQILGSSGAGAQPDKFNWVGLGTSTNAATTNDTALGGEVGTRQQDTDPTFPALGQGQLVVTFGTANATGNISESGVFNSSNTTCMLCRTTFAAIAKGTSDSLQVTWDITISS